MGYARGAGFAPDLLVGTNARLFAGADGGGRYLYALYWSLTTLAGNEWNVRAGVGGWVLA